ncbi:hypothetical protein [Burkholderia sp. BCC0405]|uniref:hypothetical protein n=1 Tax=Burkholderia sp. BCC0405 TaxID=2676298 RepID=UPI00158A66DC|nr:hypothetical protein [Burkholderia sp. BCC0405]
MKARQQILTEADEFVRFLERGSFCDRPYRDDLSGGYITTDTAVARHFARNDSFDEFDEWITVTDSAGMFADTFEWSRLIMVRFRKNGYGDIESKNFNGVIEK